MKSWSVSFSVTRRVEPDDLFLYIFGKREPVSGWESVARKARLLHKMESVIGVPFERMVYIGDNNGDFLAAKDIGIDFIEARIIPPGVVSRPSLIASTEDRLVFRDWSELPKILETIERSKADRQREMIRSYAGTAADS